HYLCAYIEAEPQNTQEITEIDINRLRETLARELPDYMIPAYFVQLKKFPLNTNGKVDRKALPEPVRSQKDNYTAPRDKTENQMAEMWMELLNIPTETDAEHPLVGIDDNFFHMGGHSLKGTLLMSGIHRKFNIKLPLKELFETPTIRGLMKKITETTPRPSENYDDIPTAEKRAYYSLPPTQQRMYILYRLEQGGIGYNIPGIFRLEKEPDHETLEKAFQALMRRHEILRTTFHMVKEEPVQKIHPEPQFKLEK
ncbi:MAG: hypothetical protein GY757_29220, partial [bacterium]|nr:hypothetical protein [bacterium]